MKKVSFIIFLIALFGSVIGFSQNNRESFFNSNIHRTTFFCPGIKLGYTLGKNGGFTYGIELSMVSAPSAKDGPPRDPSYGIVLDVDFCKNFIKFHVGGEFTAGLLGFCIGPTVISEREKIDFGISLIPFMGLFAYPYYEITFRPSKDDQDLHEVGTYLKLPIGMRK